MGRSRQLILCLGRGLLCNIVDFVYQISKSACIWWMYQPKEPKLLYESNEN